VTDVRPRDRSVIETLQQALPPPGGGSEALCTGGNSNAVTPVRTKPLGVYAAKSAMRRFIRPVVQTTRVSEVAAGVRRPTARRGGCKDGDEWERCPRDAVYRTVLEEFGWVAPGLWPVADSHSEPQGSCMETVAAGRRQRRAERHRKVREDGPPQSDA